MVTRMAGTVTVTRMAGGCDSDGGDGDSDGGQRGSGAVDRRQVARGVLLQPDVRSEEAGRKAAPLLEGIMPPGG
jgi:hypothetical protein